MSDKISVIIPVYNLEAYIERTVASIRAQTYHNLEIILVNDGSKQSDQLSVLWKVCAAAAGRWPFLCSIHYRVIELCAEKRDQNCADPHGLSFYFGLFC